MVKRRFRPRDMISGVLGLIQQRNGNVFRGHVRAAKLAHSSVNGLPDFRRDSIKEQLPWNAQAKFSWASPQSWKFCQVWLVAHTRVKNSRQNGDIPDGSGQRASAIERRRKRDDAFARDAAPAWLQTGDAAERCRNADGAACVRAGTAVAKARGNGGGGTSTRSTRNAGAVPRIANRTIVRIVRCHTVGKRVHVCI